MAVPVERLSASDVPMSPRRGLWVHAGDFNQKVGQLERRESELRQQLADVMHDRDMTALAIADAACKLGISSEGVALTGPHLLMLLGDMVGFATSERKRADAAAGWLRHAKPLLHSAGFHLSADDIGNHLAQSAPTADEQEPKS